MSLYNKPTYIPSEFLKATKQGWVDTRTNEVLVAIANLDKLVKTEVVKEVKEEVVQAEPIVKVEPTLTQPTLTQPTLENEETLSEITETPTKPKRKPKQQ